MRNQRSKIGNYKYSARRLHSPKSMEEVQLRLSRCEKLKVLGTRHSFNGIADSNVDNISTEHLNQVVSLDRK